MSSARHHAEWLSLLEVSGPFLSLPVLLRVFPNELEARNTEQAQELKLAYADWCERGERDSSVHRLWVRYVLERVLGFSPDLLAEGAAIPPGMEAKMAEYGETLRPDHAVVYRAAGAEKPEIALLIQVYSPSQRLDFPVKDRGWKASPDTRMAELLHGAGVPLGLVTNGERWMLVHAPRGETTGFASWYADLWMQEPLVLRSFYSLLNRQRLIGVAAGDRLVDLLSDSAKDQQEVTDQLGYQVRKAVEVFVNALDRIDQDTNRELLKDVPEKAIYDGALTVMMRLVFLFKAEELGLLLLGDEVYDENYAVSTLRDQLRERADQHGEEILERRSDAWCRLLATFRAVYAGTEHDTMRLPPYGGTLLDPDRYPFLEGRKSGTSWRETPAKPLPINNRVVLHLLEALQILRVKVPGGGPAEPRRLSFRSLDIEQIGHVYEGLLDHTARRATQVILGLAGSRDSEPEVPLAELEQLSSAGSEKLAEFLGERTRRSKKAIEKALAAEDLADDSRLTLSVGGDKKLGDRLRPFAGLLREDSFGQWVVIKPGGIFVTSGSDRRSTGTHYTPRSLTEPVVQHTLEPLVYVGPAEGKPKSDWVLKTPKEILSLKVCDMAMGSGAFLVQSCRYLAERLVEAWEKIERANAGQVIITPEGELSAGSPAERLLPVDQAERITIARRFVADRCLYGVDINPMAVEMAKLSLWLITLQRDRPFTFLDHALKCGDSLLGVSSVHQIENFSLRPRERQVTFATANLLSLVGEASAKRRTLEDLPSNDHTQIEAKNRLHAEAEAVTAKVKAIADCLIALEMHDLGDKAYEEQRTDEADKIQLIMKSDADALLTSQTLSAPKQSKGGPIINQLSTYASEQTRGRSPFHWAIEFPEVFARGGFDAFLGNPPFMGGTKVSSNEGQDYLYFLVKSFPETSGNSDLATFFVRRVASLLHQRGSMLGLVTTSSILAGDSYRGGIGQLLNGGSKLVQELSARQWPGQGANVAYVALIMRQTGEVNASVIRPHSLLQNDGLCNRGADVFGEGFILNRAEYSDWKKESLASLDVVMPYLGGAEFNNDPELLPSRYIINFGERTEAEAKMYHEAYKRAYDTVRLARQNVQQKDRRVLWWLFATRYPAVVKYFESHRRCIAIAQMSKHLAFAFVTGDRVFANSLLLFLFDSGAAFAALQSSLHAIWVARWAGAMRTDTRYTSTDCFETFPFPTTLHTSNEIGERYSELRRQIMVARQEGLTKTYNRFHDRGEQSGDITRLRELHVEMDQAVAAAYGWSDLDLGHGFHETKQGERYTLSESARSSVLDRLLALNHERYAEENAARLRENEKPKKTRNKSKDLKSSSVQGELL